jgi:hypothetical protein
VCITIQFSESTQLGISNTARSKLQNQKTAPDHLSFSQLSISKPMKLHEPPFYPSLTSRSNPPLLSTYYLPRLSLDLNHSIHSPTLSRFSPGINQGLCHIASSPLHPHLSKAFGSLGLAPYGRLSFRSNKSTGPSSPGYSSTQPVEMAFQNFLRHVNGIA